jgi:hypothetical protein
MHLYIPHMGILGLKYDGEREKRQKPENIFGG